MQLLASTTGPPSVFAAAVDGHPDGIGKENIWSLSRSKDAAPKVLALLRCSSDRELTDLVEGLRSHIWEASKDPHAHRVIVDIITRARLDSLRWMFREMCDTRNCGIIKASKHRFQCLVVRAFLERLSPDVGNEILEDPEVRDLCMHDFGSFVVLSLLKQGTENQIAILIRLLIRSCSTIGTSNNGAAVLSCALENDAVEDLTVQLALALLVDKPLIVAMGQTRHGSSAIKSAIQMVLKSNPEVAKEGLACLKDAEQALIAHRYGRALLTFATDELIKI